MPSKKYHDELLRKREARDAGRDPYVDPERDPRRPLPDPVSVEDLESRRNPEEALLDEVRRRAEAALRAWTMQQEAIMSEKKAKTEILSQTLEAVKPALRAIASKIERHADWLTGGPPGKSGETTYHEDRGICIVDRYKTMSDAWPGMSLEERDSKGHYGGRSLYLLEDGRLAIGERSGSWEKGAPDKPGTCWRRTELRVVDVAEAAASFAIVEVLESLSAILQKQAGREGVAQEAWARAAKLVAALDMALKAASFEDAWKDKR